MLETMATMVPGLGWLLPIPFYFMELLVGLVQALVFMLLDRGLHAADLSAPRGDGARTERAGTSVDARTELEAQKGQTR